MTVDVRLTGSRLPQREVEAYSRTFVLVKVSGQTIRFVQRADVELILPALSADL